MAKDLALMRNAVDRLGDLILDLNKTLRYRSLFRHEQVWLSAWIAEASIPMGDKESCKKRANECLNEFINKFEKGGK